MGKTRQRVVFGLGAAVAAVSAAAMISGAIAPAAHADDISTGISDIEAAAQTDFGLADTDLGSASTEAAGLTYLFDGLDDDLFGVAAFDHVATVDVNQDVPVIPPTDFEYNFTAPTSDATAITEAQSYYAEGVSLATTIEGLPTTDTPLIALDNAQSAIDQLVIPGQLELIGALAYLF
jgi:hypothetical protein